MEATQITLTTAQTQALAGFMSGRVIEEGKATGALILGRSAAMTQAEAKPLIAKGLVHAEFKTGQCGIKEWTLTPLGKEVFARVRIARGRTFLAE